MFMYREAMASCRLDGETHVMPSSDTNVVIARCLDSMAECLGLIGDVLSDLSMDAAERARIAQEVQDRAGRVIMALPSIDPARTATMDERGIARWEEDGGLAPVTEEV